MKYVKYILTVFLVQFILTAGITGKLTGVIKDSESGEPLIGCNIILEGTFLGTASNDKGEYIILNIPPNSYSIRFEMIGYKRLISEGVIVSSESTVFNRLYDEGKKKIEKKSN